MRQGIFWLRRVTRVVLFSALSTLFNRAVAQEPQPSEVVQKLYKVIVTRHPLGVPNGPARTEIWPLLSKRLIKAFETRNACDQDWERHHRNSNPPEKAPGFYEDGLFSGSNERGVINGAEVDSTKMQADGSYLAYINVWSYFDMGEPSLRDGKLHRWHVAARVIRENERFVVDDILGFKGVFDYDKAVYMSKMIALGFRGTHSVFD